MVHWRENYVSYSENVKWPVCHYDEPLGTQVYLEFGGSGGDGSLWVKAMDANSGKPYWYHSVTRATTWDESEVAAATTA